MNRLIKAGAILLAGSIVYKAGRADGYLESAAKAARRVSRPEPRIGYSRFASPLFDTMNQATEILDYLRGYIIEYGCASVHDFYELSGMKSDYTMKMYGWYDLRDASVIFGMDVYRIKLPRPVPID